jgi:Asp-tRNA(Asn)/Glu-tRNA(Gln) amidotransferase A subunit family amidase
MPKTATELWHMSATELGEAINSRQVSRQEVIEAHLERIEAVNGFINAVVIGMAEQALKRPRRLTVQSPTTLTWDREGEHRRRRHADHAAVNALGLPAVALPVGIRDGLPQAVQVIGPRYREDLCLDAAAALENRVGIFTPIDPR